MVAERLGLYLLRGALAFAFLYPAMHAWVDPAVWLGYIPPLARGFVPDLVLLHTFGAIEIVLALGVLSGGRVYIPAILASFVLTGIVVVDWHEFTILFRDLSIAAAALGLAAIEYARTQRQAP